MPSRGCRRKTLTDRLYQKTDRKGYINFGILYAISARKPVSPVSGMGAGVQKGAWDGGMRVPGVGWCEFFSYILMASGQIYNKQSGNSTCVIGTNWQKIAKRAKIIAQLGFSSSTATQKQYFRYNNEFISIYKFLETAMSHIRTCSFLLVQSN